MALFRSKDITREQIIKELKIFDEQYPTSNDYDSWLHKDTFRFVLEHDGKLYPPKYILSRVSKLDVSEFSGGVETNSIFTELGFIVKDKIVGNRYWLIAPYDVFQPELFDKAWNYDIRSNTIAIGWDDLGEVKDISDTELKDRIEKLPYEVRDPQYVYNTFDKFYKQISLGDIVIARKGVKQLIAYGKVIKTAYHDREEGEKRVPKQGKDWWCSSHFIGVKWKEKVAELKEFQLPRDSVVEVTRDRKYYEFILDYVNIEANPINRVTVESFSSNKSLLAIKKQIIFYGPPGTGKTYRTKQAAVDLLEGTCQLELIVDKGESNDHPRVDGDRVWIFQANPNKYDIFGALSDPSYTKSDWSVGQYKNKIKKGDICLIWASGPKSGIYAIFNILSDPMMTVEDEYDRKFWLDESEKGIPRLRVKMELVTNMIDRPLLRDEIKNTSGLENLSILKFYQGTNFPVDNDEWIIIKKLIDSKTQV